MSACTHTALRHGPYLRLASGALFYLLDPRPEDLRIEDIAHGLAYSNRFNGARGLRSIAQHSVTVSRLCDPTVAREGLLHDAAEAMTSDVPTPTKDAMRAIASVNGRECSDFDLLDVIVSNAIAKRFRLRFPWPASVHLADAEALAIECRDDFVPEAADVAERSFLDRFAELFPEEEIR